MRILIHIIYFINILFLTNCQTLPRKFRKKVEWEEGKTHITPYHPRKKWCNFGKLPFSYFSSYFNIFIILLCIQVCILCSAFSFIL